MEVGILLNSKVNTEFRPLVVTFNQKAVLSAGIGGNTLNAGNLLFEAFVGILLDPTCYISSNIYM